MSAYGMLRANTECYERLRHAAVRYRGMLRAVVGGDGKGSAPPLKRSSQTAERYVGRRRCEFPRGMGGENDREKPASAERVRNEC